MNGPHNRADLGYRGLPSINDNNHKRPLCLLRRHNFLQFLVQAGQFLLKKFDVRKCLAVFRARSDQGISG